MDYRTSSCLVKNLPFHTLCLKKILMVLIICASSVHSGSAQCSCYSFHRDLKPWTSSRDFCKQGGGDLVSMEKQGEWEFIKNQTRSRITDEKGYNEWWIGLVYQQNQRQWKWLSNHNLAYSKWQPGKPKFKNKLEEYAIIAKNYPRPTDWGLFNNVVKTLQRGRICEYHISTKVCSNNNDIWCPFPPTSSATTTITITATSIISPSDGQHKTTTRNTAYGSSGSPSDDPRTSDKKPFPVYVIIIVLVVLLLFGVVLAVLAYRLKRKRELKPRNSHFSKNARVPVTLEPNSTKNANDKIIYADVIKMDGGKIQINCDSQYQKGSQTGEVIIPYSSNAIVSRNTDKNKKNIRQDEKVEQLDCKTPPAKRNCLDVKKTREAAIKRVDSEKVHLMHDMDGGLGEQDDSTKCLYENLPPRNESSKVEILQDNGDASQEPKLLYVQISDIKESDPSCPVKMPSPYSETDYAVIVTSHNA